MQHTLKPILKTENAWLCWLFVAMTNALQILAFNSVITIISTVVELFAALL